VSTSLLYHAFSIRGYEYVRTEYQGGNVVVTIQQAPRPSGAKLAARGTSGLVGGWSVGSGRSLSAVGQRLSSCRSHVSPVRYVKWSAR
jgi:hypothetical protein